MAERQQYSKPPLIEAVLELRFGQDLSDKELTRVKDRLQRAFPAVEELKTFQARLEAYGAVRDLGLAGFKLTAKNGADVVLLQRNTLVTSRLPPYHGWALALNFRHAGSGLNVLAQVAIGDPVLIDHASVFVDLDCSIEEEIPANMGQFWKLVETMRDPKDEIFESLITPEVRELFK